MTAGIKQMLAERETVKSRQKAMPRSEPFDEIMALIDKASAFIDAECGPCDWRASDKLKVAFFVMATGDAGPERAGAFVFDMLDKARKRWLGGLNPDPFTPTGGPH